MPQLRGIPGVPLLILLALMVGDIKAQGAFGDMRNLIDRGSKTHTEWAPPRSLQSWNLRRVELKNQILAASGLYPMPERTPLHERRFGRMERRTYSVETVLMETLPGLQVAGNLYLPHPMPSHTRIPAVLVAHGHWKHGRVHNAEDYSVPALCVNLAAQGYAVFAWDMVGYNDTKSLPHEFGNTEEERLWSFSPLGIQLWNAIRAIDFIQTLPFVNPSRIGMTGASGGGTQTFLTAAVDERILAAAPVDMVSAGFQGDDACEIAPSLRLGTNNVEIASMIAPRPMMLISSTRDWTRNTPHEEFPLVQAVYRLYGRSRRLRHAHIDAPHNYNRASREAAYGFFAHVLKGARTPAETPLPEKIAVDLDVNLLLAGESVLPAKQDKKAVLSSWRSQTARAAWDATNEVWRQAFFAASGIRWPEPGTLHMIPAGPNTVLARACCGDRIPVRQLPGNGPTVIEVHSNGMTEGLKERPRAVAQALSQPRLLIDPFQLGLAFAQRPVFRSDHLTFFMSDDANRVQDILSAIAFIAHEERRSSVELECYGGEVVPLCHVAAALSRVPVTVTSDGSTWKPVSIPGFSRLGGSDAVARRRQAPANLVPSN